MTSHPKSFLENVTNHCASFSWISTSLSCAHLAEYNKDLIKAEFALKGCIVNTHHTEHSNQSIRLRISPKLTNRQPSTGHKFNLPPSIAIVLLHVVAVLS